MPSVEVRWATARDVPALVALVESAYRGDASRAGWTTEADLLAGRRTDAGLVSEAIAVAEGGVLVVDDPGAPGTPLACCQLERRRDHAYFGMFAVRPTGQGGGVGKALMAAAERIAHEEWRVPEVRMTVLAQRPELIAWYERRGYRRTGGREPFPYGDERFGVPLVDDLEFEVLAKPLTGAQGRRRRRARRRASAPPGR